MSEVDPEAPPPSKPSNKTNQASKVSNELKDQTTLKNAKPPSYMSEVGFLMVNLFLIKLANEEFFTIMTFLKIAVPMIGYLICCLALNLIDFMKLIHLEEMANKQ